MMRDDIDIDYFKHRLETRRTEIEAMKKEIAPVELDQSRMGRLTRMDAMQQQAMSQAAARLTQNELQRIRTALDRINSGEYGYCVRCEEDIAEGRLRVDPSVLNCIGCARAAETG